MALRACSVAFAEVFFVCAVQIVPLADCVRLQSGWRPVARREICTPSVRNSTILLLGSLCGVVLYVQNGEQPQCGIFQEGEFLDRCLYFGLTAHRPVQVVCVCNCVNY